MAKHQSSCRDASMALAAKVLALRVAA